MDAASMIMGASIASIAWIAIGAALYKKQPKNNGGDQSTE